MRRAVDRQLAPLLHGRASAMRAAPTSSEALPWEELRGSRLGFGFRRQVPLGRFVADFCAPSARLVVEDDGGYHAARERADARRDRCLARLGYRVLRLPAEVVMGDMPAALAAIRAALAAR